MTVAEGRTALRDVGIVDADDIEESLFQNMVEAVEWECSRCRGEFGNLVLYVVHHFSDQCSAVSA